MEVTSKAVPEGSTIATKYLEPGIGGQNVTPDLTWSGAPEGTKSFAITVYDPDAPTGSGFWHWIAFDIPADVTSLDEGEKLPKGVREWGNDYGYDGYGGPYPPPGPAHRYVFTVHALPVEKLDVDKGATSAQARFAIFTSQLDSASTTGTFGHNG